MPGIALITGAAQGIGRAIACRLSRDGFRVALSDLPSRKRELEDLQQELSKSGGETFSHPADVSVESEVETMMAAVVHKMGGLDAMIANAGICTAAPLIDTKREDFERLFAVNVNGTFFCYKHAAIQMIKQGRGGRIIGASSVAGKQGAPFLSGYSSSKFAIRGMTQSAAAELGEYGITVNSYAPGTVDTPMIHALRDAVKIREGDDPTQVKRPIDHDLKPEDVAGLVSYLASKDSAMVTGQSLSINGGMFYD